MWLKLFMIMKQHEPRLLDLADPPTAIFAGSDQQALGVYEAARQPLADIGRVAAEMLGDLIEGLPLRSQRVELSTELIVRKSTAEWRA